MRQNKEQLLAKVDQLREQAAAKMDQIRPVRDQLATLAAEHDWLQAQIWDLSRQAANIKVLPPACKNYSGPRKRALKKPLDLAAMFAGLDSAKKAGLLKQLQAMKEEV